MLFAFSRTESSVVYDNLLQTFDEWAHLLGLGTELVIKVHVQDHSFSILNSF
jgi:hypothetical protein